MTSVKRRAYAFLVANAVMMGLMAVVCSDRSGQAACATRRASSAPPGSGCLRCSLFAFIIDIVPRTLCARTAASRADFKREAKLLIQEHWTRDRIQLVVLGLICFYVTYVSYRNLKNFLPELRPQKYDYALHRFDEWLMFGNDPAKMLHDVLGTGAPPMCSRGST